MDSYLEIAQKVLRISRRPMTAKAILDAAYKANIVPQHLYGKTQHKTLQARLSENILHRKHGSEFYRTEPGRFFLHELISDPGVPDKYKEPFSARRRTRDLHTYPYLAIERKFLKSLSKDKMADWNALIRAAEVKNAIHYINKFDDADEYVAVWTFSLVKRETQVLAYRIGRYRDDRDAFANRRTIGFPGLVNLTDIDLFSHDDYGVHENAINVILADLDISLKAFGDNGIDQPSLDLVLTVENSMRKPQLLVILEWACPDWFEPTTKRLSLNDPYWLDLEVPPNHLDDFEPWSIATIEALLSGDDDG